MPTQNVLAQDVLGQENFKYWILAGGALVIIGLYFTNRKTQFVPQQAQEKALPQKETQLLHDVPTHDIFVMD